MIPLPSLEEIAAHPERLHGLTRTSLRRLRVQALLVAQVCELAELKAEEPPREPPPDETLDVTAAAKLVGISPHTLRNRARTAPYVSFQIPTGTRRLAFSRRRIIEWQHQPPAESARVTPKAPPDGTALAEARRRLDPGRGLKNFNPPFLGWPSTPSR